jgi:PHS family inorganic phosphate transporter-like MFS transporter
MLSGVVSTLLLPETCGRSLEELSNEDQKGFVRGALLHRLAPSKTSLTACFELFLEANAIELRNGIVLRKVP